MNVQFAPAHDKHIVQRAVIPVFRSKRLADRPAYQCDKKETSTMAERRATGRNRICFEISGSQGGEYEDESLLGYGAV
jgi:hypothetical protein